MLLRCIAGAATCGVIMIAGPIALAQNPRPASSHASDARLVKAFEARVAKYLDLRKKQAGSSLQPRQSSAKLDESEREMAAKVRDARPNAKQGDIFTPEIAGYFRRQIAATLAGPEGAKIRASLRHAEPLAPMSLRVNQSYPQGVPLQSTPPTLLLNLPKLPKELEYRIVGEDLVLHDIVPNLVVDFIPHAIPASGKTHG